MPGFDIVVAHCYGIVSHIVHEPYEKMLGQGIDIVVIIGGLVSLKAVTGIDEQHVLRAVRLSHAVHIAVYGKKAGPCSAGVRGIEPCRVDIVSCKYSEIMKTVSAAAGGNDQHSGEYSKSRYAFHSIKILLFCLKAYRMSGKSFRFWSFRCVLCPIRDA